MRDAAKPLGDAGQDLDLFPSPLAGRAVFSVDGQGVAGVLPTFSHDNRAIVT
jgi:hypothetical protein